MTTHRLTDGVIAIDRHTLADADDDVAGEDEEQAWRFGWHPARSTSETVRRAIEEWQTEWTAGGTRRTFAIRDARTGSLAGGCQVRLRDGGIAEMSYWVFPAARGNTARLPADPAPR